MDAELGIILAVVAFGLIGLLLVGYLSLSNRLTELEGETTDAAGGDAGVVESTLGPTVADIERLDRHMVKVEQQHNKALNALRNDVTRLQEQESSHTGCREIAAAQIRSLSADIHGLSGRLHALEHPNPQRLALDLRYLAERLESTPTKDA